MYNAKFFRSKLGHASLASIGAMIIFIALSSQITPSAEPILFTQTASVIIA